MKNSYLVIANYNATASDFGVHCLFKGTLPLKARVVEADSPEEAVKKAQLDAGLCHACRGGLNLGEIESIQVVSDGGRGEVVYTEE